MGHLGALGLAPAQAVAVLTHRAVGVAQSESGVLDGVFDASDRIERAAFGLEDDEPAAQAGEEAGVVLWWNDLEKDARYQRWAPTLSSVRPPLQRRPRRRD